MPPKDTEIGRRLKAAREKLGLTQDESAQKWGFSVKTLRAWEQGWNEPRGLYLEKLEGILREIGV
jgi:DNA-binding transcriptional regulator YiaG